MSPLGRGETKMTSPVLARAPSESPRVSMSTAGICQRLAAASSPETASQAQPEDPSASSADDSAIDHALRKRLRSAHLRLRLGIEAEREQRVFGRGLNLVHLENWVSVHGLIRAGLQASLLYARGQRNARSVLVTTSEIALPGLPQALNGLRILHLSDLHLDMDPKFSQILGHRVQDLQYDVCALTGDFRYRTYGPWRPAVEALGRLRPFLRGPVYGVLGNHDSIRMVPAMEDHGVRLLMNESDVIRYRGAELYLAGVDDPHYYQADNLEAAAADIPDSATSVLLAHSPEIYRRAAHSGFSAMLCGHTHGGQIRLPGGIPLMVNANCPRRFCAGTWEYAGMRGYTSAGAGSSVVDARLNCPPEVTLHTLRAA